MEDRLSAFYTNLANLIFRFASQKTIQIAGGVLLVVVFGAFRVMNANANSAVEKTISSLLRHETRSANSYAVSKTISDLENLDLLTCSVLLEFGNQQRAFYASSQRPWCLIDQTTSIFANVQQIQLKAGNGTSYVLKAQLPVRWTNIFLEACLYFIVGIAMVALINHRKRVDQHNSKIVADLELQKSVIIENQRQIKHDVASPLSAIKIAISRSKSMDSSSKEVLERALSRTENLFQKLHSSSKPKVSTISIREELGQIIAEKKLGWGDQCMIHLNSTIPSVALIGDSDAFKSMVSNILNNSLEAGATQVFIAAELDEQVLTITVRDNGCGIDKSDISQIGQKGFSRGKVGHASAGQGLGLYSAVQNLQRWSGRLNIDSQVGVGTRIDIRLPISS